MSAAIDGELDQTDRLPRTYNRALSMIDAIGQYRILDRIGSSGLGEVYRARDTRHGRTVAITVVASHIADDADRRARFLRDAHAAATVSHPNIAALYEAGDDGGRRFLAFEFVPGEALARVIAGRPLNPRRAVDLAAQIADGLAEAHALGLVHGGLTSASIVITPKDKAKILDFGLAAWMRPEGDVDNRHDPALSGGGAVSIANRMDDAADASTDVRALGAVLFEMLTGQQPEAGADGSSNDRRVRRAAIAPSAIVRTVPPALDAIAVKAVAQNRSDGYESAAALAADLRAVAAQLDARTERNEAAARRPSPPAASRRRPWLVWIVFVAAAAALAAAAWWAARQL